MEIDLMRAAEQGLVFHEATGQKLSPDDLRDMEIKRLQSENAKLKKHWFDDADPQETCFKDEFLEYRRTDFPKEPDNG